MDVYRDNLANKPQAPTTERTQLATATAPKPVPTPAPEPEKTQTPPPQPAPVAEPAVEAPTTAPVPRAAPVEKVAEPQALDDPATDGSSALASAFSLRFEFGEPVAAAAFRRGGSVWLVFDKQTQQDLNALKTASNGGISQIEQIAIPRATVLRMETAEGFNPRPKREGLAWVFDFGKLPLLATQEIEVQPQPHSPAGSRLFMSVQEGGLPVPVQDPVIGDNLVVVPVIPLGGSGLLSTVRNYPSPSYRQYHGNR